MENAAKALQIAAGTLISVLVLGLIVYVYNNLSETKQIQEDVLATEQATNFNKSFEAYNRELMGTEIISLANKVKDYNRRYSTTDGYINIQLVITNIPSTYPNYKQVSTTKPLSDIHEELEKKIIEEGKNEYTGADSKKYTYNKLQKMSDRELQNIWNSGDDRDSVLGTYKKLLDEQTDFSREYFECTNWNYDNKTGRIVLIEFKMK